MRRWILTYSTTLLAVSSEAARGLFGPSACVRSKCQILTGLDFSPFSALERQEGMFRELGIPAGAAVVGHVGSFRRQKNHAWFVEVAKVLAAGRPDVFFLLVGDGPLRHQVEASVKSAGLWERFRFAGERGDMPAVLVGMDTFLFPSFYEGMPRALLEAQAVGLPCVASDTISPDAAAFPEAVNFLSLGVPAVTWALAVEKALRQGRSPELGRRAVQQFAARGLTMEDNARFLTEFYEDLANAQRC
jgi:glycosyltransferase involved in cell wall biosynthesis